MPISIAGATQLKNGYIRFDLAIDGLIIKGFRTTKILNIVLPPESSYHGHPYRIVDMSAAAEAAILSALKSFMEPAPKPELVPDPKQLIYCARCGCKHEADYHKGYDVG